MRTGRPGPSTSDTLFRVCLIWFIMKRRRVGGSGALMAGAFSVAVCSSCAAPSRDSRAGFWQSTNARINPETHERWYLRVCTRLLFSNLRVLSSLRIQISCFWRPALGPLAFSSPRGSRAGSRSDTKPGSGAKPRADPRETRFLRLAPRTQSYARAKCCAALPSLA